MKRFLLIKRSVFGLFLLLCSGGLFAASFNPFYEDRTTDSGSFFAIRPFYSCASVHDGQIQDVFWPLYSRKEFKDEQRSRVLLFWYSHTFDSTNRTPRDRTWLLPIYFQGRDVHGEEYFAIFPLGGTIREFLGRDEISFVLFPIFGKSRVNDVKTTSVFWPIYSRTRGEGIQRDRVFPIVGKSVLANKYEKRFVLWPFWTTADYFYPGDSGSVRILFPVYGRAKMDKESTWWVIPPFFRFTEGERQDKLYCPWPFIQRVKSEHNSKFYIWPLWGEKLRNDGENFNKFVLWPIFWSERYQETNRVKTCRRAVPVFSRERIVTPATADVAEQEISNDWMVWPLMSWQRVGESTRFRTLELWPIKNTAAIDRNWAPLWTLYKRTDHEGVVRKDFLWFAWHSEREPDIERTEWSLLKGFLAYKKEGESRSVRFLYGLHWGDQE